MKVLFLTTQTPHHSWFAQKLAENSKIELSIISQTQLPIAKFETFHPFELQRDDYEKQMWFGGQNRRLKDFGEFIVSEKINDDVVATQIQKFNPDLTVVFGTSIIKGEVLRLLNNKVFNLHGGNPESYRGLDSHLWAIYNKDFKNLSTCLHKLSSELDAGDIFDLVSLNFPSKTSLFQLRYFNTLACWELTEKLIEHVLSGSNFICRKQKSIGKMYSFMPTELKETCRLQFEEWTNGKI